MAESLPHRSDRSALETAQALAAHGLNRTLGLRILDASASRVVGEIETGERHLTSTGRVHGGTLMAMADALGAIGTVLNLPAGASTATIESKTNFLKGARPGLLRGEAQPLHVGRMTMVWQTTLLDGSGQRVAIITQTQIVLAGNLAEGIGRVSCGAAIPSSPPT